MKKYYVYQYLREDGSPYYIGKGKDRRAWVNHTRKNGTNITPENSDRIEIIKDKLTEEEAHYLEKHLISKYGRKDNGTGILQNLTDGGEGTSGRNGFTVPEEVRQKISKSVSESKKGKSNGREGTTHTEETKEKIRAQVGWKHSDEAKKKMRKPRKPLSDEHRRKLSEQTKKYWKNKREN